MTATLPWQQLAEAAMHLPDRKSSSSLLETSILDWQTHCLADKRCAGPFRHLYCLPNAI